MRRLKTAGAALALARMLAAGAANAQVVERHLPPAPTEQPPALTAQPPAPSISDDERPLGIDLRQVVILGAGDSPLKGAGPVSPEPAILPPAAASPAAASALRKALAPFLGKPLSRRRVSEIEAAIVRLWRATGHPLVDVSTPPQELSGGRLQIRLVEYRLGQASVAGANPAQAARVLKALRLKANRPIDIDQLSQDLAWLDRYPFRSLRAAFAAGAEPGETDLRLTAAYSRPIRVYAGYDNSGAPSTGEDRYFVGALLGLPILDASLSYQLTASPDYFDGDGRVLQQAHPRYVGQAFRVVAPIAPRQALELAFDTVQTNQTVQDFETRLDTTEASLAYRFALSNLWGALPGDGVAGLEAKRQQRSLVFGGALAAVQAANVDQAFIGWSYGWSDRYGRTQLDTSLHLNPGNVGSGDTAAALEAISAGRDHRADYLYGHLDMTRTTRLPLGLVLSTEAIGQVADRALPSSEQIALGGVSAVRGYSLDDGAYDGGLVVRNDLQLGSVLAGRFGAAALGPLGLTLDLGAGRGGTIRKNADVASIGLEQAAALGPVSGSLGLSDPLANGPASRAGHARLDVRVTLAF